ncbi:transcriptional regulator family: Fungal Specific TF [Penicillium atrosanguineum]|nr:transcriptional regulator family: Fungal Specific TF [Penicillium atrosanguineum]
MDADESLHVIPAPLGKKRIPKACSACRLSKVRCDEERPCGRCQKLEKQCVFFEIPKDPVAERIEGVESEVQHLRVQLDEIRQLLEQSRAHSAIDSRQTTPPQQHWEYQQQARRGSACTSSYSHHAPPQENAVTLTIVESNGYVNGQEYQRSLPELSPNGVSGQSAYEPSHADNSRSLKRKRSCFEIRGETVADFIDKGLITPECAYSCFNTFFQGCDRYIPIFDPEHDTFDSIRSRSSILLNAICTIGCMVETTTINDTLVVGTNLDRLAITDFVHEMKIDLDLWFDDWLRIIEGSISAQKEKPYLLVALRVQKCWAEMMLNCKALRTMGVENVAAMSSTERNILLAAKASARRHLRIITVEPDFYLAKLKYAMDFVWAKCAFSFLLLLKLSRLLPERDEEHQELLEHGNRLVDELSKAGSNTNQSRAGNIYLQILKVSIEKYGRALQESQQPSTGGSTATSPFWELFDAQADLQWFVPEQFVSEWDFPGLNLFYFPTAWQDFFGDFSLAM